MTDGSGGAQGAGAAIVSAVGTASATSAVDFDRSPTSYRRIVQVPSISRAVVVRRLRDT